MVSQRLPAQVSQVTLILEQQKRLVGQKSPKQSEVMLSNESNETIDEQTLIETAARELR